VKIAVGTDAPAIPHGKNADELVALVERGLPPLAVLRAATIVAADLINVTGGLTIGTAVTLNLNLFNAADYSSIFWDSNQVFTLIDSDALSGGFTTVVNNLVVTNNLAIEPEIRCRILLTTPLEVFAIGNTIVISRGMLDVLPDEGTLAMALSGELAQIVLGNTHITKFAFQDLTMFPDRELLRQVHMQRSTAELTAGDARAVAILAKSPYKDTGSMGLFLNALSARMRQVPNLVTPLMGDGFLLGGAVRMPELMSKLPESQDAKGTQVAALPLGGRIKVNPWNDEAKLLNARPAAIFSFRDNIPFEVTPFKVHLPLESTGAGKPLK